MSTSQLLRALFCVCALILQACSYLPFKSKKADPLQVIRDSCLTQKAAQEVSGSVWMKAKSKEASGQFPAAVLAKASASSSSPPSLELRLEITEIMGSRVALIEIRGDEFNVETPNSKAKKKNAKSWGGIPLEWASQLFLDRIPCPSEKEMSSLAWNWLGENEIEGRVPQGEVIWRFKFREWNLKPWVSAVSWQKSPKVVLEVRREDPELNEGWAQKWEASSEFGQVKVRWKDRAIH